MAQFNLIMYFWSNEKLPESSSICFIDPFPFKSTEMALKTLTPFLDGIDIPFATVTELSLKNE